MREALAQEACQGAKGFIRQDIAQSKEKDLKFSLTLQMTIIVQYSIKQREANLKRKETIMPYSNN